MKEFRVLNKSFKSSVKPGLKVLVHFLSVPSCCSLTIIIVWENHMQWRPTDCLGVAKL